MVADIRGWGALQYKFKTNEDAKSFQNEVCKFIVESIREKIERTYKSNESGKSEKPTNQTEIMYSEEDLREAFKQSRQAMLFEKGMPPLYESFEEWFEQFKKK